MLLVYMLLLLLLFVVIFVVDDDDVVVVVVVVFCVDVVAVAWLGRGQDTSTTPLYVASQNGHDLVVRTLLASGANVIQARAVSDVAGRLYA